MDNPEDKNVQNGGNPVVFWISVMGNTLLYYLPDLFISKIWC